VLEDSRHGYGITRYCFNITAVRPGSSNIVAQGLQVDESSVPPLRFSIQSECKSTYDQILVLCFASHDFGIWSGMAVLLLYYTS